MGEARVRGERAVEIDAVALRPQLQGLASWASSAADSAEAWRSPRDRVRVGRRTLADAAGRALGCQHLKAASAPADERFYVCASIFGHHLISSSDSSGKGFVRPLAEVLRERAARLIVAREIDRTSHPLATVEALLRGQGP